MKTLEINLLGVLYSMYIKPLSVELNSDFVLLKATHLASHYFKVNRRSEHDLKALILIGSVGKLLSLIFLNLLILILLNTASWRAMTGGNLYAASKHAVLGLMRSKYPLFATENIRIACIHPFYAGKHPHLYTDSQPILFAIPDTAIVPAVAKVLVAGIPLTPVERIAGAIFYAATDPEPGTSGSAWMLLDDGPVFRLDREELKEGVYGIINQRIKRLFRYVNHLLPNESMTLYIGVCK
jgi:NAD(P)-dependent dehydrogenase (short-subunit alcohol dehydrogenase family)